MTSTSFLSPDGVFVDFPAADKSRLLRDLSDRAATKAGLDQKLVLAEVLKREELGSTGVGKGVAIPHARLDGLARPIAIVARLRRPIDFDAVDGEPVDLVTLLLLPVGDDGNQINVLAAMARCLRNDDLASRARRDAATPSALVEIFRTCIEG